MADIEFFSDSMKPKRKGRERLLIGLALASLLSISSTVAANININTGRAVEFGQGLAQATACDTRMIVELGSNFTNSSDTNGTFAPIVRVSDIGNACDEKIIRLDLLASDGSLLSPEAGIEVFFSRTDNGFFISSDLSVAEISTYQVVAGTSGTGPLGSTRELGASTFTIGKFKSPSGQDLISRDVQKVLVQTFDKGTFQLASAAPELSSLTRYGVTSSAATIYAYLDGAAPRTQVEFCYGTRSDLQGCTKIAASESPRTSNGSVTAYLSGLTAGTTYYWRATAKNSRGTSTSSIQSFETSDIYGFVWADCSSNTAAPCPLYGGATYSNVVGDTYSPLFDPDSNSGPQLRSCPPGSAVIGLKAGENNFVGEVSPICATYPGKASEISLETWSLETFTVTTIARSSNIATLTTSTNHNFGARSGNRVVISSLSDISFNDDVVASSTTSNTFSYSNSGANVSSTSSSGVASVIDPSFIKIQRCEGSTWLTGLGGRAGAINDAIQGFCRSAIAASSATTALPQIGGMGGGQITSKRCPANHLITAFWVWHPEDFRNWGGAGGGNGLAFRCTPENQV